MRVEVTLVVFQHPEPARWGTYASYCPATKDYCSRGNTVKDVITMAEKLLLDELKGRLKYNSLKKCGWEVSENSAIPPIFVNEYAIQETERIFEMSIKEPIIIKVDVELPTAKSV